MKALFPFLLLAGCATAEPAVRVETVEVPVIRVEKCVAKADVPELPAALPPRPSYLPAALDLALAKVLEWVSYGEKADAVLQGCAE